MTRLSFRLVVILLSFCILGLQYRLWIGEGSRGHIYLLETRVQKEKKDNAEKRLRNAALRAEIADLKDNTQAIEAIARSDLGMIQDGEILYILPRISILSERNFTSSNLYYDLENKLKSDGDRFVGKEFRGVVAWI